MTGKTKTEVKDKLRKLHRELERGVRSSVSYTVGDAGGAWQDHGLVFASPAGAQLDRYHVRREFGKITVAAGLGDGWVPREMRHTFVSLLSSSGTPLEEIADLVGHKGTATTETVYRSAAARSASSCPADDVPQPASGRG